VDEVLATDDNLRIARHYGDERIHFLICDATGDRATIEILDGKMVCHRGKELPVSALTNDTYDSGMQFVRRFSGFGGSESLPQGSGSLERFVRAASRSKEFCSRSPEEDRSFGFQTLRNVAQGEFTVWSIVYDIPNRRIYYRTRENDSIRFLGFDEFKFSPKAPLVFLDINAPGSGGVADQFRPLTEELHKKYLLAFFGNQEVKERMGDQTPMVQVILALLRTYQPE
jgi:choloylglycine hydrolase